MEAVKGDWVRIHKIILTPEERSPLVPEDTGRVPLEMWDKGFLLNEKAAGGEIVDIETIIGRRITGSLEEVNPQFRHSWGELVPEILQIGKQLRRILDESGEARDE